MLDDLEAEDPNDSGSEQIADPLAEMRARFDEIAAYLRQIVDLLNRRSDQSPVEA